MVPILLKSYLKQTGDDQNKIELSDEHLAIGLNGKFDTFRHEQIQSISVTSKKLIIPLVIGGIGTCLSMLALSMGWYHYQTNLMCVFLFFGWMYYGFLGREAIVIQEKNHQNIYLIKTNTEVVKSFISFYQERKWKLHRIQPNLIYHVAELDSWRNQETSFEYSAESLKKEKFIHASSADELERSISLYTDPSKEYVLLSIHAPWLLSELKWEYNDNRQASFPHIFGKINKSAIIQLTFLQNLGNNKLT